MPPVVRILHVSCRNGDEVPAAYDDINGMNGIVSSQKKSQESETSVPVLQCQTNAGILRESNQKQIQFL
jgi:hypothetical protein